MQNKEMGRPMQKAKDMLTWMTMDSYTNWYKKDVAPNLTKEQKDAVMRRVSDMTLEEAIWLDHETNYIEQFPELEPYSHNKKISGMQLCAVMEAIFRELYPDASKAVPQLPWAF